MRYIGGKSLMIDNINNVIEQNNVNVDSVIDIFSGSGVVAANFKNNGYQTISNDYLYFSYVLQKTAIELSARPCFGKLGIADPIAYLNGLKPEETAIDIEKCFIYNNYSPSNGCQRMYFQPENALKIDIIRITIQEWFEAGQISDTEYFYLLSCLINAVPYVANITGVYAAYLKYWDNRTYNPLTLTEPTIHDNGKSNKCYNKDFSELLSIKASLLYADPPYNQREYLPNYHILETIARYDYPSIKGVTGMRNYDNQKSVFSKKNTVHSAFETLIRDCSSEYILISYNNEGLISTEELSEICRLYAVKDSFKLYEYDQRRYKNKIPNNTAGLKEQLYLLRRH